MPVNIKDTGKSYELQLVAPGLQKQDFKVNLNGDTLTVSYEHKEQQQDQNNEEGWLRNEYRVQSFSRSFTLDDSLEPNKISARYSDGILHLSIPKKEGAQKISRNIEIS
ncbi:MAG: Hsp20/alpha crystallin family protein [Bacteroidetes bacterium]|nr:Hsp20/alpha crystallin family protein [Bacteroidota bacterium]